jgi:hypothetical protein
MLVLGGRYSRPDIDAYLDGLTAWDAQIVPLEIGAIDSRLLRQTAADDQDRDHSNRFHVGLLFLHD